MYIYENEQDHFLALSFCLVLQVPSSYSTGAFLFQITSQFKHSQPRRLRVDPVAGSLGSKVHRVLLCSTVKLYAY